MLSRYYYGVEATHQGYQLEKMQPARRRQISDELGLAAVPKTRLDFWLDLARSFYILMNINSKLLIRQIDHPSTDVAIQ